MSGTNATGWATGDIPTAAEYQAGCWRIYDSTLGVAAASIDITSIVATYAHLMLVLYARGDAAATSVTLGARFNNDSATNYDGQYLYGSAAAASVGENFTQASIGCGNAPAATAGANLFGQCEVFVPHYAGSTNNKTARAAWQMKTGILSGNLQTGMQGNFWRSNTAINRITLFPSSGNFAAGTRATLYGIGA